MSFRHIAMFTWNDDVDPHQNEALRAGLDALPGQIDVIRSYVHGPDVGVSGGNFDYAVVADFDSEDDWRTYRDHPVHRQLIADHITGKVASRAAIQFRTTEH